MNKNTIIAIALSTVVVIGAFFITPLITGKNKKAQQPEPETTTEKTEEIETVKEETAVAEISANENEETVTETEPVEVIPEEIYTIETDLLIVKFTNKGGDIISYQLKKQADKEEEDGMIQLSDSITGINRTCAISLGNSESSIINEIFRAKKINDKTISFAKEFEKNGKKYTLVKDYSFKDNEYLFKLDVTLISENGANFNDVAYTIRTAPQLGPYYDTKADRYEYRQYLYFDGKKYKEKRLSANQFKRNEKEFIWQGMAGKYFVEIMIPENSEIINAGFYSTKVDENNYQNAQALLERKSTNQKQIKDTYYMYFGPRSEKELKRYNVETNNNWNYKGEKLTQALATSGWLSWLETILKWALELIHKVIKNWGVCIIVLTLLIKALMFPLSRKQSMSTLKMQDIQPKLKEVQEKYKNDPKKQQAETAKLYQEIGYNPMSGCLPMIFQFLILFAMYGLFNNYFEFRGSEFIPNWIPDLSKGDSVWGWNKEIPFLSGFTGNKIRLLPVIYLATQLLYGKVTQYGGAQQNSKSMKFMTYGMPIIFFFLFYSAPAGLLIYWIISNVFQMGQQLIINKMMTKKKAEKGNTDSKKILPPKAKGKNKK